MRFCLPSGHCERAAAMAVAARKAGHTVVTCARGDVGSRVSEFDVLLSSGFASLKREQIAQVISSGKDAWVFDLGYFHRDYNRPGAYFQISINGLARIPKVDCPVDRWLALDLPILPSRTGDSGGPILICAQKFGDNQHLMDQPAMEFWIKCAVAEMRRYTDRKIVLRPHPASMAWSVRDSNMYDDWQDAKSVPIQQAVSDASLVVTYNSTSGLEAIRQGVPIACDSIADYYPLSVRNFGLIDMLWTGIEIRSEYLARVAYGQWTQAEHENGAALAFMLNYTEQYRQNFRAMDIATIQQRLGVAA